MLGYERFASMGYIFLIGLPPFPGGASGKEPTCQCRTQETRVQSLGCEDPLEKEVATHSSILAWKVPWTGEPDGVSPWGRKESDTTE